MSYRRDDSEHISSSRWRLAHEHELLEAGVPADIAGDDRSWTYFLLHGGDGVINAWEASWLSIDKATKLLRLLEANLESDIGYDLVRELRHRCRKDA